MITLDKCNGRCNAVIIRVITGNNSYDFTIFRKTSITNV